MLAALDLQGNASSVHAEGRRARAVVEDARECIAALVGAKPEEVVFTSGATEANNWVVRGGWERLLVGATEHDSVLAPARSSQCDVFELACDPGGLVAVDAITGGLPAPQPSVAAPHPDLLPTGRRGTGGAGSLVSIHLANAETGVVQPIAEVAEMARRSGYLVHCDAVQAVGRVAIDFGALGLDFMSVSAHKLGGPKGAGALVIRDGIELRPFLAGGGQERRRRSGTENVAAIAGFGAAASAALDGLGDMDRVARLRDRLEAGVKAITADGVVIGSESPRLPNTSCIALAGADASTLLIQLDLAGIAVSAGSACSSGKIGGGHVLAAMGIESRLARGAIRVSLGPTTTEHDVERFIAAWEKIQQPRDRRIGSLVGGGTRRSGRCQGLGGRVRLWQLVGR
jgi:cysteine desulfurase